MLLVSLRLDIFSELIPTEVESYCEPESDLSECFSLSNPPCNVDNKKCLNSIGYSEQGLPHVVKV